MINKGYRSKLEYDVEPIPNVLVIGVRGPMASGKDTLAGFILEHFKGRIEGVRMSFADPLKAALIELTGCTEDDLYTWEGKHRRNPMLPEYTNREVLQIFGTEAVRMNCHFDFWVRSTHVRIKRAKAAVGANPLVVLVPDVRYNNEAEYIRKVGFLIDIYPGSKDQYPDNLSIVQRIKKWFKDSKVHSSERIDRTTVPSDAQVYNDKSKGLDSLKSTAQFLANKFESIYWMDP